MNRSNPFTAVKESVSHNWHKVRARSPRASNWEKLQALDPEQTPEYRDVHGDQQLDRRERTTVRSQTLSRAVSTVVVILVAVLLWIIASLGVMLVTNARAVFGSGGTSGYYVQESEVGDAGEMGDCYYPIDAEGEVDRTVCYDDADQVPVPGWYAEQQAASGTDEAGDGRTTFVAQLGVFTWWKLYLAGGVGAIVGLVLGGWWGRQIAKHNITVDHADINDHYDDPHIAQPEELQRQLAHFPDAGAHSSVQVTAMISHNMLTNKGLDKVALTRRHEHDVLDEDGNVINHAGEPIVDEDGEPVTDQVPWIDGAYGQDLFETSGVPQDKKLRTVYDPTRIAYGGDGGRFATVAALINTDWTLPEYEVQRPAGTYLVDSDPVNTMIIAMTRAGKGQTYIEPVIDMWSREANPNNMVINDPKGELLVKFYVALVMRGFKVVQFNLINPLKTDIYNPLMLAADAARENDSATAATYVENLGNVFFPTDTGDDPMWNNAANNAFKRAAFGLIDYYLEEEREMRARARNDGTDPAVLDQQLDEMWGRLTLYNCYQLFVQLSGQKLKNPLVSHQEKLSRNGYATQGEANRAEAEANERVFLWEGAKELDMLTLFFNATASLPLNSMRTLVNNADKSLRSMGSAEKMIASVYGIAITAMSFFTKPTIAALTSGRPSQNIDLGGISFPRRLNVRLAPDFVRENHLVGMRTVWSAYADPGFTQNLGKKFDHSDLLSREGWARYYIEGIFPEETVYVKLELRNPVSDLLVRTLYFEFRKGYQLSLNGRHYVEESVTGKRIVRDGVLRELRPVTTTGDDGEERTRYLPGHVTYRRSIIDPGSVDTVPEVIEVDTPAIIHTIVRYGEQPSAVFLVTPPHLASYAKILLILIEQMVSLNFERSYMTKENQKPLHKTRFMLDELGNLQSEGKGIESFETKLSIGLGQDQQFTLILQTLQQLRDVYGDSVDKVLQGNCQPLSARIATPTGWRRMGDLAIGDKVLTPFGTSTRVTAVYPNGVMPVYRVRLRDGSATLATGNHLWDVQRWKTSIRYTGRINGNGRRKYVGTGPDGHTCELVTETITTDEMIDRINRGQDLSLPRLSPLAYDEVDVPVDPYVLGVTLGDGCVAHNGSVHLGVTEHKNEIIEEIERRGYTVSRHQNNSGGTPSHNILGVAGAMHELGLQGHRSWDKFVPEQYLHGSIQQRIDLLRGLMDTDGTVSRKFEVEYTTVSERLAHDVQALIRSLGGRVTINIKEHVTYTNRDGVRVPARKAYRLQNVRLAGVNPFSLSWKAQRWHDDRAGNGSPANYGNAIASVEYVGEDEVQCIRVADERHLYVTDDYLPTHNTSHIIFLKSTDDSLLETLEKMGGKTHRVHITSKSITENMDKVAGGRLEGAVSRNYQVEEEPLISYNDLATLPQRNSIVYRAGEAPVWNRNSMILPMSWRLRKNDLHHPGHTYSLQTVPTLSTAIEFDVRHNQPDFKAMLDKRIEQAVNVERAQQQYKSVHGYNDVDIERLDPDVWSDEIMEIVTNMTTGGGANDIDAEDYMFLPDEDIAEDVELHEKVVMLMAQQNEFERKIYAEGTVSRDMLVTRDGNAKVRSLDARLIEAYTVSRTSLESDHDHFSVGNDGSLRSADGRDVYVTPTHSAAYTHTIELLDGKIAAPTSNVWAEGEVDPEAVLPTFEVTAEFYRFLAAQPTWTNLGDGSFDRAMAIEMDRV